LRQMGVTVDKPGENCYPPVVDPFHWPRPLRPTHVVVISHVYDAAFVDYQRSSRIGTDRSYVRRIDQETAEANRLIDEVLHTRQLNHSTANSLLPVHSGAGTKKPDGGELARSEERAMSGLKSAADEA
jgi:hypothetical protein